MPNELKPKAQASYVWEEGTPEQMTVAWAVYPLDTKTMRWQVRIIVAVGLAEVPENVIRDFWIDAVSFARIEQKDWPKKVLELAKMAVQDEAREVAKTKDYLRGIIREPPILGNG